MLLVQEHMQMNQLIHLDLATQPLRNKGFCCSGASCGLTGDGPCAPGKYCPTGSIRPNITQAGYHDSYGYVCLVHARIQI